MGTGAAPHWLDKRTLAFVAPYPAPCPPGDPPDPNCKPGESRSQRLAGGGPTQLDVALLDLRSARESRVTRTPDANESDPVWSPDGRHVAFLRQAIRSGAGTSLWTAARDGGSERRLLTGSFLDSPEPSPDGRRAAALVLAGDRAGLWVVGARGGRERRIASGPVRPGRPASSPDGALIAFNSPEGIEVVGPAGSGRRVLVGVSQAQTTFHLAWSPDGRRLAYTIGPIRPRQD